MDIIPEKISVGKEYFIVIIHLLSEYHLITYVSIIDLSILIFFFENKSLWS